MIASLLSKIGIEVWRDIPNYEDNYQVSNLGNVRSLKNNKIKLLKKTLNNNKRFRVGLSLKGKARVKDVHVLVAIAFLKHTPCGMEIVVDHIDNNSLNNKLYKLQLITQRKNCSKDKKGYSNYTGVTYHKGKYMAYIKINNKQKHLGYFKAEKEAAQAYQNELTKINKNEI